MKYYSTRDRKVEIESAGAIAMGLSREGGLFVPERLPKIGPEELGRLCGLGYRERAVQIMKLFLEDYSEEELRAFADAAYSSDKFDTDAVAPVVKLGEGRYILELWHGPTSAFKDMALQILPHLLTAALKKTGEKKKVCILVATSGDTGKAALEGFRDVEGTKILVFYPRDGVSDVQKLQMTSQEGTNVRVAAIEGNFDDAQSGVKEVFSSAELREELAASGWFLSSANSINWGRLLPQIVYYFSAYCDLLNAGEIEEGEKINFSVPTGNFGDILAGFYAMQMGLPVSRLICASNKNDVLTDFFRTGEYNRVRPFYETISPSMDILISSNLERLLSFLSGSGETVAEFMDELKSEGRYSVSPELMKKIGSVFSAGSLDDEASKAVIKRVFEEKDYLMDTHTAVAYGVMEKYREESGDKTKTVTLSTASPFKFTPAVLDALGESGDKPGPELISVLSEKTGKPAPRPLAELAGKKARFTASIKKDGLFDEVRDFLK
ncbi:MAG: threonine synthase [Oscillospiraceae bacterium]|nr:threonine synthase [Oscillospiraceae bacterium]